MNIYLAARWSRREELRQYATALTNLGHHVTSRWLYTERSAAQNQCLMDLEDLFHAECCLNFTENPDAKPCQRGGRHVEFGLALSSGKRVVVIGPRENIFHHHPRIEWYPTWDAFLGDFHPVATAAKVKTADELLQRYDSAAQMLRETVAELLKITRSG